jgi:hypothetical protein
MKTFHTVVDTAIAVNRKKERRTVHKANDALSIVRRRRIPARWP